MTLWKRKCARMLMVPCLAWVAGCSGFVWFHEDTSRPDPGVEASQRADLGVFQGTVGSICYYDGLGALAVRGYGLVVGLGGTGSRDCPRHIRERLVEALYKRHRVISERLDQKGITSERMIDDLDSAVVVVNAAIPPGATKGTRIDVAVAALPGTQTNSLEGGRLLTTELHVYRTSAPGVAIMGKLWAISGGPIFLNPFSDDESATQSNPLSGIIVGGGAVTRERDIRLVLTAPSYGRAIGIRDRINRKFGGSDLTADALSPAFIMLHVPREYADDRAHFLPLVRSLYVSQDPAFEAARAEALGAEMVKPDAPCARIGLCLEGLGRTALPVLARLYNHEEGLVRFHAALAGLRLGDHVAGDAVERCAQDQYGAFRFAAVRALSDVRGMAGTAMTLRHLLEDKDLRIRVAAYEGLIRRDDPTIVSRRIGIDNFVLDLVPSRRTGFVYVKRTRSRRIALFGDDLRCSTPVFYRAPDGSLMITGQPGDEGLTLLRTVVGTTVTSPPIPAPFELPDLIALIGRDPAVDHTGAVIGLGLDYGAVVRALYHLCNSGAVDAELIVEQPNVLDRVGQPRREGRPESES